MSDWEEKFAKSPQDTQLFEKLMHVYTKEELWTKLTELYINHAAAIKETQKNDAYNFYLQAIILQKLHDDFSVKTIKLLQNCFQLLPDRDEAFLELELYYRNEKKEQELLSMYAVRLEHLSSDVFREELLVKMGNLYLFEEKNAEKAASCYQKAHALNAKNKTTLYNLFSACKEKKQTEDCIDVLEKLITLTDAQEKKDSLYFQLAEIEFSSGALQNAANNYKKIHSSRFRHQVLERLESIYQNDATNLVAILLQKLSITKQKYHKTKIYKRLAQLKEIKLNEKDVAILFYEKALLLSPDIDIIDEICRILWGQKKIQEWYLFKKKKIAMLISKEEKIYVLHSCAIDLKSTEQSEKNIDRLIEIYEAIIEFSPQDKIAIDSLIEIYKTLHRHDSLSKVWIHKAKYSSFSERVSIYIQIAKLFSEFLNQQEEASIYYKKVMALQGDHNDALQQLRNQYTESQNYNELVKVIIDEIRLTGIDSDIRYHEIGNIYRNKIKDAEEACVYFRKSFEVNSLFLPSCTALRELYLALGQFDNFFSIAQKELFLLQSTEEKIELYFLLAKIYKQEGNAEKQKYHLHKILQYGDMRAVDSLLREYEEEENWNKYISVLNIKSLATTSPEIIADAYSSIAQIYEEKICDNEKTREYYEKVYWLIPTDISVIKKLFILCCTLKDTNSSILYLKRQIALTEDVEVASELEQRVADIYSELKEREPAILYYEKAYKRNYRSLAILLKLEQLFLEQKNYDKLFENLHKQTFLVDSKKCQILYRRLADIATENKEDLSLTIEYVEKLAELDFEEAYPRLELLYNQGKKWTLLIKLYNDKLEKENDFSVQEKLAQIYENHVDNKYQLKNIYKALLDVNFDPKIAIKLEDVCESIQDWEGVADILQRKIEIYKDEETLGIVHKKLGYIYSHKIPDLSNSIYHYSKALEIEKQKEIFVSLKELYFITHDYEKLLATLDHEILNASKEEQYPLFMEQGEIYRYYIKDISSAINCYNSALELSPQSMDALCYLDVLLREKQDYDLLINILNKKLEIEKDKQSTFVAIASVFLDFLDKKEKALEILENASKLYPENLQIKEILCSLYLDEKEWIKLADMCSEREVVVVDAFDKADLLFEKGKIYEDKLNDSKKAATIYVHILTLVPDYIPAIKSLQMIYKENNNLEALAESYLAELAIQNISTERKEILHIFCAELFEENLEQKEWAITHYLQVLKTDINNLIAIRGLQDLYRKNNKYEELTAVLVAELSIEKKVDRLFLVEKELAEIYLHKLSNIKKATKSYIKAHDLRSDKIEVLEVLNDLLLKQELWKEHAHFFEKQFSYLKGEKRDISHILLANVYAEKLGNQEKAIIHLELAYKDNANLAIVNKLEQLYQNNEDIEPEKLLNILNKKLSFSFDEEEKVTLFCKIGQVYLHKMSDVDNAISFFEKALDCKPSSKSVFNILAKLYTKNREWKKLIDLYLVRVRFAENREGEIFSKIGTIYEKKQGNYNKAIAYYELVFSLNKNSLDDESYLVAIRGIRRLFEKKKDWKMIALYLQLETKKVHNSKELASLHFKTARIWEQKLGDPHQAVGYYLNVIDNHYHKSTANHTVSLLKGIGDYSRLCDLLTKMIERSNNIVEKTKLLCELGKTLSFELKNIPSAIEAYQKALEYENDNIIAINNLESIYEKQKEWLKLVEIKKCKLKLLKEKNELFGLHSDLGRIYHDSIYDEKNALYHYEKALILSPGQFRLMHILQNLYYNWGHFQLYINLCKREVSISKDIERKIHLFGEMAFVCKNRLFENSVAIKCYEEILKLDDINEKAMTSLIVLYEDIEDYENLVKIYKLQIIQKEEDSTALKIIVATILRDKLNKLDEAEHLFSDVLNIHPSHEEALGSLRELYAQKNDIKGQGEVLEKEILLEKDSEKRTVLYLQLAKIYESDNRFKEQAIECYEKYCLVENDITILYTLQKLYREVNSNSLIELNQKILKHSDITEKEASSLYLEIGLILKNSSIDESVEALQKSIKLFSANKKSSEALTCCFEKQEKWEDAIESIQLQVEQENDRKKISDLLFRKGKIYEVHISNVDKAKEYYDQALSYDKQNVLATCQLAGIMFQFKWWDQAQELYQNMLHISEKEVEEIYYRLGYIAEQKNEKNTAILHYQKSLDVKSNFYPSLHNLGDIYYENAQWDEALLYYMKIENTPVNDSSIDMNNISLRLAVIKDKMGILEGAIEGYTNHLKEEKEDVVSLEALARLHFEREDWEISKEYYEELLQKDVVNKIAVLEAIGKIQEKLGDIDSCIETYRELCEQAPQNFDFIAKFVQLNCKVKNWEKAREFIEKSLLLSTNKFEKIEYLMMLAETYWKGEKDIKSVRLYKEALELLPENFQALQKILTIYKELGKYDLVIEICDKNIEHFSPDSSYYVAILNAKALCYLENLQDEKKAIETYELLLEIDDDHVEAHAALASLSEKDKNAHETAITEHFCLLINNSFRIDSYNKLFEVYKERDAYDRMYLCCQAILLFEKLLPKQADFFKNVTPRVPSGWLNAKTQDSFIPEVGRGTLYEIMASIDVHTDKAFPVLLEKYTSLRKKENFSGQEDLEIQDLVYRVLKFLSIDKVNVSTCDGDNIYLENTNPTTLVIGLNLWRKLSSNAKKYALARTLFYVARKQVMAYKLSHEEYASYISILVETFAETGKPSSLENDAIMRKLRNSLPRKIRKQLEERMDILTEIFQADSVVYLQDLEKAANNCGLLMSDSLQASVEGYCHINDINFKNVQNTEHEKMLKALFCFNISEEHSLLRRELGLEIKWLK